MRGETKRAVKKVMDQYDQTGDFDQFCEDLEDLIYPDDREIMEIAMEIETAELEAKEAEQ